MISNTVVEGSMTRDRFLQYLEFTVVYLGYLGGSLHAAYVLYLPQDAVVFPVSRIP